MTNITVAEAINFIQKQVRMMTANCPDKNKEVIEKYNAIAILIKSLDDQLISMGNRLYAAELVIDAAEILDNRYKRGWEMQYGWIALDEALKEWKEASYNE